jgi:exodeoxyribonuclease VII small subunit
MSRLRSGLKATTLWFVARRSPPTPDTRPESADGADAAPSFEDSIRRLGEIVDTLEGGDLPLDDSLKLFEEGVRLARASQSRLERAERRVDELLAVDESGRATLREIEPE